MKLNIVYDQKMVVNNWVEMMSDTSPAFGITYTQSIQGVPKWAQLFYKKIGLEKLKYTILEKLRHEPSWGQTDRYARYTVQALKIIWAREGRKVLLELEKMYGPFAWPSHTAYITNLSICDDYPERHYFYLSMRHSLGWNINTIAHELSHALFLHHSRRPCVRLGLKEPQIQDLKESMSVLLNSDRMQKLLPYRDVGYRPHEKVRRKILDLWKKGNTIPMILPKVIPLFQKHH